MAEPSVGAVTLVAAVNDEAILDACLRRSPDVAAGRIALVCVRGARNMGEAYNQGLEQATSPVVLFAHQDVYLPAGWLDLLLQALTRLDRHAPDWMVAGPYGVRADGAHAGLVWDVGLARELGTRGFAQAPVVSLDELLLILKPTPGFRFDPDLPHFHLYGTDLVQTCLLMGRSAWAIEAPVVHNSQPVATLAGGYSLAYRYARDKWREHLPIPTTVCTLTRNPVPLWRARWRRRGIPARDGKLLADAVEVSRQAGFDDYAPA
jgi:hypothetical protein